MGSPDDITTDAGLLRYTPEQIQQTEEKIADLAMQLVRKDLKAKYLEQVVKRYASHAWNDIEKELERF